MRALMSRVSSRSGTTSSQSPAQSSSSSSTSSVFPGLRKLDVPTDALSQPLLTLTLSAPSFLDSVVKDEFSGTPLFIIETHKDRTGIYHCDSDVRCVAKLQWPSASKMASANAVALSGIAVQMHGGRWLPTEEFMKFGSLFASRKFSIPHHTHSLKWKRAGSLYNCTCSSVKGPVATLEAAVLSAPPRLKIFSSLLREPETAHRQPNFGGIPYALMDYLITTSLILVTDIEEWLHRPSEDVEAARSAMDTFLPEALRHWRKDRAMSYLSTNTPSPNTSVNSLAYTVVDDSRSIMSDLTIPSPSVGQIPYSFSQMSEIDSIPPVPEVPAEHQSSVVSLIHASSPGGSFVRRRQLPLPPGQSLLPRADQPWLRSRPESSAEPSTLGSNDTILRSSSPSFISPSPESSMSSIPRRLPVTISQPPPQHPMPLAPKLINELKRMPSHHAMSSVSTLDAVSITDEAGSSSQGDPEEQEGELEQNIAPSTHDSQGARDSSLYDLPPPAYDAIDFTIPRPSLPEIPLTFQSFGGSRQQSTQMMTESS